MKKFLETLTKILLLNFIFLFLMALSRVAFCFYYGRGILSNDLTVDILKAFGMGARFDLSVLAYINLPVTITLIVLFFIGQKRYYDVFLMILKYYYTIIMGGVFVFLSIDFGFYSYFQNHLNVLAFGFLEDDTQALLSTFSQNYNLRLIIFCFILEFIIVYFISRKILKRREISYMFDRRLGIGGKIVIAVLVLAINALLARGSVGTFPLEVDMTGMAEVSKNPFINKVAVNGFYTLQAAMAARSKEKINLDFVEETGYGGNIRQAFADYLGKDISEIPFDDPQNSLEVVLPFDKTIESIRPNVIFIVMESLGSSLLKYDSPDFNLLGELRQHFQEDIVFYNFLPAGDGTMVSLEGIVTNLARRPGGIVLSQTQYAHKKSAFGAAVPYKQKGYETLFIYGGGTGWRNLDVFLENLGFDQVIGQAQMDENYPKNQWGVYDEYLFDYVFKVLTDDNKRKFIGVLSTTNHPPFTLPKDYKSLPLNPPAALRDRTLDKELAALRYEAYQYANRALANFIAKVKRSPYANNTIIVVTGDHSFWSLFENTN
ncbi:MAG: sulfatase-like hydrolase/transferase, partial [Elusimicrobiota bacterium]|nr:sulfatase-like hydrolase/transferase [Elusimicrobiota bacterium]